MSKALKTKAAADPFLWVDADKSKPMKGNRVLCSGDDMIASFFVAYWTGKQWKSVYGKPLFGRVDHWCYIKTPSGHVWYFKKRCIFAVLIRYEPS